MADDPIDDFRLSLMQDLLPMGLAMFERARKGGAGKVVEALTSSSDPFLELKEEGEPVAKDLRERLDQVSPGLGNPVIPVDVAVEDIPSEIDQTKVEDKNSLNHVLEQIEQRLIRLNGYWENDADQ